MKTSLLEMPRLIIAGASSDSGKTTLTIGLIGALRRRGLRVSAAKVGPDFIDAAHLARASDRPARNLDAWIAPAQAVITSFARGCVDTDIAVIEGAMGLFDGHHSTGQGSSAHIARILEAPVVLVLDCAKASSTIGAIAFGLANFDPSICVAGAILNRVASDKHAATVRQACLRAGVAVLGVIRRDERLAISSRHLGLSAPEGTQWMSMSAAAAEVIESNVDLDALLAAAASAPALTYENPTPRLPSRVRIALARDQAFWFYDEASLEALQDAGAQLVPYAPLQDAFPNDVHAAFIGGGYPEAHAAGLEANLASRDGLRRAIEAGMPTYAECGGLMYLGANLETPQGSYAMVGAFAATSTLSPRRCALRYVQARALSDGPLFAQGEIVRGHEFHYSRTTFDHMCPAYAIEEETEGYLRAHLHASYVHLHLGASPDAARRFVALAHAFGSGW